MQKRTMSAVGETKRKELDKLIMLGEMKDREIANELSIDCGLVISRRRTLRNRKNFNQKCEKLRKKVAVEAINQQEMINVENQIPDTLSTPETAEVEAVVKKQRKAPVRLGAEAKVEVCNLYISGKSVNEISEIFNCCPNTISKVIINAGLVRNNTKTTITNKMKADIIAAFKRNDSVIKTAKLVGCSETTVRRVLTEADIYKNKFIKLTDDIKLQIGEAYEKCQSFDEVAQQFGCSVTTVFRVATDLGLYTPKRKILTHYLRLQIAEAYEKCQSLDEVAQQFNCCRNTVRRCVAYSQNQPKKQEVVVETSSEESIASTTPAVAVNQQPDFVEIDLGKHVVCSMFADRHDVPKDCKESIFDTNGLESNLVLDFAWIDSKIQTFILNHINFDADGRPDKDLVVYLSGLQSTLGSICKFCAAMGIKLTLMHYDPAYGKYFPQVVIEGSTNTVTYNSKLGKLLEFDHVLLHKDMDVEFLGSTSFYAAVKTIYKDVEQHKQESWCYICPAVLSGFDAFRDLTIDIRNHPEAYGSVYLYQVNNRSNGLYFSGSIAKSYNFKKG